MEEFDPQRPTPEHVCRSALESCDVYVLGFARRWRTARLDGRAIPRSTS